VSGFGGIFGLFLPGNDIPDWFTYKDEGASVCFEVPLIIDCIIEGFTVCIVYSSCLDKIVAQDLASISVINYTKSMIQTKRPVTMDVVISHEDHMWQGNVSKSNFNLEAGDEVEVIVDFGSGIDVKKIGVRLVYDKVVDGKMIHYASTSNKDAIVVSDNEDASTIDQVVIESKRGHRDDKAESSRGCFDDEREAKRLRCEHNTDDKPESSLGCFDDDQEAKRLRCDDNTEMIVDDD
jgi:hypothetical protein